MSKRRVIFPPPEFWTKPKEPAMTTTAADYRRATAITVHHREVSLDGVLAIITETNEQRRAAQLLLAVLNLHGSLITQLRTDAGINMLANFVTGLDNGRQDEHVAAAARILDAHGRNDLQAINNELAAGDDQRATLIFTAVLDIYGTALPELSSGNGIKMLHNHANHLAGMEVTE